MLRTTGSWLLLALLIALAIVLEWRGSDPLVPLPGQSIHVIDGDSFRIGSSEIRLAGIDAPEYRQTCLDASGAAWPCGKEARSALDAKLRAGGLRCVPRAEDRYRRSLAHCTTREGDVAAAMARDGWALDAGDERFAGHKDEIERARAARRGVWRGRHQHPADWRKLRQNNESIAPGGQPDELSGKRRSG